MSATLADRHAPVASNMSGDPDFAEILEFYLASMSEKLSRIEAFLRSESFAELRREAHQIRGSAANYGYPELSELSGHVEGACRDGDHESARRHTLAMLDFVRRMTQG